MAEQVIRSEQHATEADRQLLAAIRKTLSSYEPLRATKPQLDVEVQEGRVRLSGRMRTSAMKEIAEYMVMRLPGVRAVRNDVVADPEVVRAVADALATHDRVGPACVQVDARNGMVTLAGAVPDESVIRTAEELAAGVPVVAGVTSRLTVRPEPAPVANGAATTIAASESSEA